MPDRESVCSTNFVGALSQALAAHNLIKHQISLDIIINRCLLGFSENRSTGDAAMLQVSRFSL